MYCEKCGKYSGKYSLCKDCYYENQKEVPETVIIKEDSQEDSDELICPICGEPTSVYMGNARKDRLCRKHGKMLKDGEILIDSHDRYREKETGKIISNANNTKENNIKNDSEKIKEENEKEQTAEENKNEFSDITCIICGNPSNGKHFCAKCYKQYANKVLYIQVKKCKEFTKLEAEYESDFTCEDGHLVKSPYEKIIDDWLYRENVKHAYEKKLDIDETHDITPDFYIPEYNGKEKIYVEFWGYGEENSEYKRRKEYKTNLYPDLAKKENIAVVYLTKKDVETDNFKKKIKYAEQGKIKE